MIKIIKKILNGLHRSARRAKELSYNFINFFGAGLKLNHFTKDDLKSQQQWYENQHLKVLLKNVTRFPDKTLKYFQLNLQSEGIYEPLYKFTPHNNDYINQQSHKLLYCHAKNIIEEIERYLIKLNPKKNVVLEMLSADADKMTADRMVVSFLAEYLEQEMIKYDNDPEDLKRLDNLIAYFARLVGVDSIKANSNFLHLLSVVQTHLEQARQELAENIARTCSITTLASIEKLTRNTAQDLSHFLSSIVQFQEQQVRYTDWQIQLNKLISCGLIINEDDLAKYQADLQLCLNVQYQTTSSTQNVSSICPAFVQDKKVDEKISAAITNLQQAAIGCASIFQVIRYVNTAVHELFAQRTISSEQIKDILFRLDVVIKTVKNVLDECQTWRAYFDQYCASNPKTDELRSRFDAIISAADNMVSNADLLLSKIKDYREGVLSASPKGEQSSKHITEMCKTMFGHDGLHGKSAVVISKGVSDFINSLRTQEVFDKNLSLILQDFFYIETKTAIGDSKVVSEQVMLLKSDSEGEISAYQYLSVFLQIIIRIHKCDFPKEGSDIKTDLIAKFVDYMIKNLLLHDSMAIKLLFQTMLEQVSLAKTAEEKHAKIKSLVQDHLNTVKADILLMIRNSSGVFQQKDDADRDDYEALDTGTDTGFIEQVLAFVRNVVKKITRTKNVFLTMRISPALFTGSTNHEMLVQVLQQYELQLKDHCQISELLICTLSVLTTVSTSVMCLEQQFKVIEGEVPDKFQHNKQEIDTLLRQLLQEKQELRESIENIQLRVQSIKKNIAEAAGEVFKEIKNKLRQLLKVYDSFSHFTLMKKNIFCKRPGVNMLLEYAAVKYMYSLICQPSTMIDNSPCRVKFIAFVSFLKHEGGYTDLFRVFIDSVYSSLVSVAGLRQIVKLPLLNTSWKPQGLGVSTEKIDQLQAQIEKDVDSVFKPQGYPN